MFFIGIFGVDNKRKEVKRFESVGCKGCNNNVNGTLIKDYSFFHFFFIPIFKWNEKYYFNCKNCNKIFIVDKEKGKELEKKLDSKLTYWDLKEEVINNYGYMKRCNSCGEILDGNYKYCPYCGNEV